MATPSSVVFKVKVREGTEYTQIAGQGWKRSQGLWTECGWGQE